MTQVLEIFNSISGEVTPYYQGCLTTFVRLAGCNLNCSYCFGIRTGRKIPKLTLSKGGSVFLNEVKVNDVILTYNENFEIVETTVTKTHHRKMNKWLRLTIDGTQYFVTHDHPFMTPKGIVKAENLSIGDDIYRVKPEQIISFKKMGERNPMKNPETTKKKVLSTNYVLVGRKISKTRKKLFKSGKLTITPMSEKMRLKMSKNMKGDKNSNWKGGSKTPNYDLLKKDIIQNKHTCTCGSIKFLEVHHLDEIRSNDDLSNLLVLCKSCHTKVHKKGYNFWNGNRRDGKQLCSAIGNNGKKIEAIKEFDCSTYPKSTKPEPLDVYNLTCSPYNTYFLDNMWVHNCDTPTAHDDGLPWENKEFHEVISSFYKKTGRLCITGGEPLLQKKSVFFLVQNFKQNWIETNGSIDFSDFIGLSSIVTDYKLDFMGNCIPYYFYNLQPTDFIKFVIGTDLQFKKALIVQKSLQLGGCLAMFAYSPIHGEFPIKELMQDLYQERLPNTIINIQIHKYLGLQ